MIQEFYLLHNVKMSSLSGSADVKAAEEFLETLGKLIVEEITCCNKLIVEEITCRNKYSMLLLDIAISILMKTPYSGSRCLKGLSSSRRPIQCQVLRLLNTS